MAERAELEAHHAKTLQEIEARAQDNTPSGTFALTIVQKVAAEKAAKQANALLLQIQKEQRAETRMVGDFLQGFGAFVSTYNLSYQAWLSQMESSGTLCQVKMILVDPPYDSNFVSKGHRNDLAHLFEFSLMPGGTAVIFCSSTQISGWKGVFKKTKKPGDWVVERLFSIHRDPTKAFRSPLAGHKNMTEYALIIHRRDPHSEEKSLQNGKVSPDIERVEAVLGPAASGSWLHDFIINASPPSGKW